MSMKYFLCKKYMPLLFVVAKEQSAVQHTFQSRGHLHCIPVIQKYWSQNILKINQCFMDGREWTRTWWKQACSVFHCVEVLSALCWIPPTQIMFASFQWEGWYNFLIYCMSNTVTKGSLWLDLFNKVNGRIIIITINWPIYKNLRQTDII